MEHTPTLLGDLLNRATSWFDRAKKADEVEHWTGKKPLTTDTISSKNLPKGVLRWYLKAAFQEFKDANYLPNVTLVSFYRCGSISEPLADDIVR
jgi:hypothetical protein